MYIAESAKGDKLAEISDKALDNYDKAMDSASSLDSWNPIKLGLALNFSVFYFEVRDDKEEAIKLADKALKEATDQVDGVNDEQYRDSKGILDLIRENLELWRDQDEDKDD